MEISEHLARIRIGHIYLVICCIFYLIWWSITFNPMKTFPAIPKYLLFICTAVTGAIGGFYLIPSLGNLPVINKTVSSLLIMAAGIALYFLLLFLTSHFLHRQVTTELFLIVGWGVLEICTMTSLYGAEAITFRYAIIMAVIVLISAAVSMVCYLLYYEMQPIPAFYDGMVPLILFGIVMAIEASTIRVI